MPPVDDPVMVAVARALLPVAKLKSGLSIVVSDNCKRNVQALKNKHSVLMINHSDRFDPLAACALSKECDESFNFLASREQFDKMHGFAGWVLQHLGTFSVIRGSEPERASAEQKVSLLVQGKHKLAEFPEGDVTGRDDTILPLKEDGLHNLFEAQRRLLELTGESLYVLPIAMYYRVRHDSIKPMSDCLYKLEKALNIPSVNVLNLSFEQRVKRAVSEYIASICKSYGLTVADKTSLSSELKQLSTGITNMVSNACGFEFDPSEGANVYLYNVRAALRELDAPEHKIDEFDAKLANEGKSKRDEFVKDLDRAEQLLIFSSTLESTNFTPEVAWRVLDRLELDVFGRASSKGHRTALIDAASPIDLVPLHIEYERDRVSALKAVDSKVRSAIFEMMQKMQGSESRAVSI